ncbi:hypothetical protein L226DRAFT_255464 [Lentinus tigrinus ALCF2SS1-7]|uniref:uncharacterized protein n=1 Tax=Lentinus tigrinus ALCF2SS1-7 TaxID=1328758 RepID=UPI00116604DC|nr:hypothetical protein L226DRAFT_255464 [Lentinus tigrinus ALCF2SS1-7]
MTCPPCRLLLLLVYVYHPQQHHHCVMPSLVRDSWTHRTGLRPLLVFGDRTAVKPHSPTGLLTELNPQRNLQTSTNNYIFYSRERGSRSSAWTPATSREPDGIYPAVASDCHNAGLASLARVVCTRTLSRASITRDRRFPICEYTSFGFEDSASSGDSKPFTFQLQCYHSSWTGLRRKDIPGSSMRRTSLSLTPFPTSSSHTPPIADSNVPVPWSGFAAGSWTTCTVRQTPDYYETGLRTQTVSQTKPLSLSLFSPIPYRTVRGLCPSLTASERCLDAGRGGCWVSHRLALAHSLVGSLARYMVICRVRGPVERRIDRQASWNPHTRALSYMLYAICYTLRFLSTPGVSQSQRASGIHIRTRGVRYAYAYGNAYTRTRSPSMPPRPRERSVHSHLNPAPTRRPPEPPHLTPMSTSHGLGGFFWYFGEGRNSNSKGSADR